MTGQLTLDFKLRDDATFENYVGAAGDRLAHESGWVFVFGEAGSGKSHLLQAACHRVDKSIYLTDLHKLSPEILKDLEHFELICLDNVDKVLGDETWEEALFHLLNGVKDRGATCMIASTEAANRLEVGLADLRSRLMAAHAIETDRLSDSEKMQVIQAKAVRRGFQISDEVSYFIVARVSRNMTQLLDILYKLEVETLKQKRRVTIPFVKSTFHI